jgi:hypothetical protein
VHDAEACSGAGLLVFVDGKSRRSEFDHLVKCLAGVTFEKSLASLFSLTFTITFA